MRPGSSRCAPIENWCTLGITRSRIREGEPAADQRAQPLRAADRLVDAVRVRIAQAPRGVMPPFVDATSVVVTLKPLL